MCHDCLCAMLPEIEAGLQAMRAMALVFRLIECDDLATFARDHVRRLCG